MEDEENKSENWSNASRKQKKRRKKQFRLTCVLGRSVSRSIGCSIAPVRCNVSVGHRQSSETQIHLRHVDRFESSVVLRRMHATDILAWISYISNSNSNWKLSRRQPKQTAELLPIEPMTRRFEFTLALHSCRRVALVFGHKS